MKHSQWKCLLCAETKQKELLVLKIDNQNGQVSKVYEKKKLVTKKLENLELQQGS